MKSQKKMKLAEEMKLADFKASALLIPNNSTLQVRLHTSSKFFFSSYVSLTPGS